MLGPVDPVLDPVATIPVPTLVAVAPVVSPDVDVDPDDPVEDPVLVDNPVLLPLTLDELAGPLEPSPVVLPLQAITIVHPTTQTTLPANRTSPRIFRG